VWRRARQAIAARCRAQRRAKGVIGSAPGRLLLLLSQAHEQATAIHRACDSAGA
jgi:hypothetical protein